MIDIILCGGSQGRAIISGSVETEPVAGQPVTLHAARMVLYWAGSAGLFGLATTGPAPGSRITAPVARVTDLAWQQWMTVSPEAAQAIRDWPVAE